MCDGSTFHLRAEAVEGIHEAVLLLRCADELVAADDPALKDSDSGDRFSDGPDGGGAQGGISREALEAVRCSHLGNDTGLISENGDVHIVVHGILGDHDIADIDVVVKGTGDSGVDQMCDIEAVDQNLSADGGIDFSDAALDDHDIRIAESADVKLHACFFHDPGRGHLLCRQFFDFKIHCTDNADFHIGFGNLLI